MGHLGLVVDPVIEAFAGLLKLFILETNNTFN